MSRSADSATRMKGFYSYKGINKLSLIVKVRIQS
jgi:hypothetical protein